MNQPDNRLITLAIHTFEYAAKLKVQLESEGIEVELNNVNLSHPVIAPGVRVRIHEKDLPLALRIVENSDIFPPHNERKDKHQLIVVPTDFSSYSFEATKIAFCLADRHKAEILFLHAFIDPSISSQLQLTDTYSYDNIADEELSVEAQKEQKEQMNLFLKQIRKEIKEGKLPPVKFSSFVTEGIPEEVILEYAKENNPFLLVMGTREQQRKERELIGSVTAEVLDSCRTITVTVTEKSKFELDKIENITFFANLDQNDFIAIDSLFRVLPGCNAKVNIVHLPTRKDRHIDIEQSLNTICEYCAARFTPSRFSAVILDQEKMVEQVAELNASLLVVANKKKNVFARLFNPGLAHRLLFSSDIPMMVVPV